MSSKQQFRIELLPALHGDSIWIEYGEQAAPTRILIDGGPIGAYAFLQARAARLKPGDRELELLVVTHVDGDHIEGAIRFIADQAKQLYFGEVWFNGWRHLEQVPGLLGAVQGEFVSAVIQKFIGDQRWNAAKPFLGSALVVDEGPLPVATLPGGMQLTLLSPTPAKLDKLRETWKADVTAKGFTPGDLEAALELLREQRRLMPKGLLGGTYQLGDERVPLDNSVANGSSIAFLAEFAGKRCLFLGDAHPDCLVASLKKLGASTAAPLKVDAVKVAHHGSKGNTTPDLLRLIDSKNFLVSTNGDLFGHPDPESIDTIVAQAGPGVRLHFNYLSKTTQAWANAKDQSKRGYSAVYPASPGQGAVVDL